MTDTIEFYPVEVIKPFMSLTVGDVLYMSSKSGNYELRNEAEEIGDKTYKYEKYEISLEPWIIEKYSDHFQLYLEQPIKKPKEVEDAEFPMTPSEACKRGYTPKEIHDIFYLKSGLSNEDIDVWRSAKKTNAASLSKEEKKYLDKTDETYDEALPEFKKECPKYEGELAENEPSTELLEKASEELTGESPEEEDLPCGCTVECKGHVDTGGDDPKYDDNDLRHQDLEMDIEDLRLQLDELKEIVARYGIGTKE